MFGWLVKFGLLPAEVYSIGIAAKPEAVSSCQLILDGRPASACVLACARCRRRGSRVAGHSLPACLRYLPLTTPSTTSSLAGVHV